ncbi:MAG: nucleoside hydrolase [Tissierellia bacterium]|nr:nucleoside hydrolase [Tissierellia bacterium]
MKKVIIDCDPGMDDSMAIVMALKSGLLDVKAITTLNGNYPVELTSTNARKVLEMLNRTEIPVAKGMGNPMVRKAPSDPFSHGEDGQAENHLPAPKMPLSEKHAVEMIIDTVNEFPGEISIACLGPLSNLAMAMVKEPSIIGKIKEVVAISGSFGTNDYAFLNATGDTPQSEWNVYVDPEAAKIVYESGVPFVALGLDVATHFEVDFSEEDIQALENSPRPEAKFLRQAIRFVTGRGYDPYCTIIDCMAVAYVMDPSFVETFQGRVGVETLSPLTLGMTVLDRRHHHVWEQLPMITIGKSADYGRFLKTIVEYVLK